MSTLGDRMKTYEGFEAQRKLMPLLPVVARIDGRRFSRFTRGMDRPFDSNFSRCMVETTKALMIETNACMAYTQSDEITLAWNSTSSKEQIWFNGRVSKMTSQLAAQATLIFYTLVLENLPKYANRMPTFDARVWSVPNRTEGANAFLWREMDATKNSIGMAASAYFSHKQLMFKTDTQKLDLLFEMDINWNEYPSSFKRGTFIQKSVVSSAFKHDDISKLPEKHQARQNPNLDIQKSVISAIEMPIFSTVTNREDVIFCGATPLTGVLT